MLLYQASCQIDHIQYQVPLKLDRITLMWLLVGVCLAILRADGRMNTNHLIGIAHIATDVNRFLCGNPGSAPENTWDPVPLGVFSQPEISLVDKFSKGH